MTQFFYSLTGYSDFGLLALRLAIGAIFLYHCRSKLKNLGSFMGFIGLAELAGGAAVALGFLTQLAAVGLGIIMIGAIYKKINEWKIPFSTQSNTGWEFDLMLLAGCVALLLMGGGGMSVDAMYLGM